MYAHFRATLSEHTRQAKSIEYSLQAEKPQAKACTLPMFDTGLKVIQTLNAFGAFASTTLAENLYKAIGQKQMSKNSIGKI